MSHDRSRLRGASRHIARLSCITTLAVTAACAAAPKPKAAPAPAARGAVTDARSNLKAGLMNAGEATSGMNVIAKAVSPPGFLGITHSDLAFTGNYAIQGNYNGPVIWDMSNPAKPVLVTAFTCPASQNDISVFHNLMFMSSESNGSKLDCTPGGIPDSVSKIRFRGVRVFDIADIKNPKLVASVQTCRGSHTHTVLEDPKDKDNVYIYVSGSAGIRSPNELDGCVRDQPSANTNSSLMRIEIIKVPLANPSSAAVVNRANIFSGLTYTPTHAPGTEDLSNAAKQAAVARAAGGFTGRNPNTGAEIILGGAMVRTALDSIVKARGGEGAPTAADSTTLRTGAQRLIDRMLASAPAPGSPVPTGSQCHDITVYPALGLAGGACEGHGLLLDISDPVNPVRLDAVADSNFAYWHSATFNNDGTKLLFSDEWGGGGAAKCRASDKLEWGSDAIFTIEDRKLKFQSYYTLPSAQTANENCVAHNGSLIPIPGRDVMVQSWYQGGISVFDWSDAKKPFEIAYFDRGPVDSTRMAGGGSWSVYWYNGAMISSEIARGLDVADLVPSEFLTKNEIDAAKTVKWAYLNAQGQPKIEWPPSFALARAYADQIERKGCLAPARLSSIRQSLANAEKASPAQRSTQLQQLTAQVTADAAGSCDPKKMELLKNAIQALQNVVM